MTIDAMVFAAGSILVAVLVWQTHRLNSRRLCNIQNDLDRLEDLASRLLAMGLNWKPGQTVAPETDSVPGQRDQARSEGIPAPSPDVEPELSEVDLLCAKLITLAPPKEALPLLTEPEANLRPLREDQTPLRTGRERLRPWPHR
jgi:hypothetical protein